MKKLICILALIFASNVQADEAYIFSNGYWYLGTQAYTRVQYQYAGYWYCGRYYPGAYYYQYTPYYPTPKAVATETGWRSRLLDIAAARDKYEGAIRKEAFEQQYFLEGVKALGLEGNFRWNGYGTVPPYAQMQMPYASGTPYASVNFGANATTQYGYSYSTVRDIYNANSIDSLFQQSNALAQQSLKNGAEASAQFQARVGQEGDNRARIAEILARGQVAQQIINSLQAPATFSTSGFSFKIDSRGGMQKVEDNVEPSVKAEINKQWITLAANKCGSCHSGKVLKGNFDIASYPNLKPEQKQVVWNRLTTNDQKLSMPRRPPDDSPGESLKPEELKLFFLN